MQLRVGYVWFFESTEKVKKKNGKENEFFYIWMSWKKVRKKKAKEKRRENAKRFSSPYYLDNVWGKYIPQQFNFLYLSFSSIDIQTKEKL